MDDSLCEASPRSYLKISAIMPRKPQQNIGNDICICREPNGIGTPPCIKRLACCEAYCSLSLLVGANDTRPPNPTRITSEPLG